MDQLLHIQELGEASGESLHAGETARAIELTSRALSMFDESIDEPLLRFDLLMVLGEALRLRGQFERAHHALEQALELALTWLPADDAELVVVHNALGMCCKYLARFDEGLGHYLRGFELLEGGSDDELRACLLHNIGGLHHAAGEPARGEEAARAGLSLRRELGQEREPVFAADLAALGALLEEQQRLDEAAMSYAEAEGIWLEASEPDLCELAYLTHAQGSLAHARGQLIDARARYEASLELKREQLGAAHPSVAITLNNLALVYRELEEDARADRLLREALALFEVQYEDAHPQVIACRTNLGL